MHRMINLYLAPTADGRATWLPLMQSVGIEGRCFVVSSNMCVRTPTASDRDGGIGYAEDGRQGTEKQPQQQQHHKARRNSCMTEEGFEIALPSSTTGKHTTAEKAARGGGRKSSGGGDGSTRARRRSIFDEDGHEIVLCGEASRDSAVLEEEDNHEEAEHDARARKEDRVQGIEGQGGNDQKGANQQDFVSRGGSCIVSPFGDVLAGPQWEDDTGIIYADVDFDDCIRGRLDLDAAGSYSRNDSFKFSVAGLDLDPLPYYGANTR
ncbi:hypothetical protein F4780DRAFT_132330 [Xylariomycetidae sp. FL0641]|nr:hypothetical protein F4780DRAFT_132330 [Xylariomycetidae sp. FL0641]